MHRRNVIPGYTVTKKILSTLQIVYKKYFSRAKSFKIYWTQKLLQDVADELEQDQIIQRQHNANHRGIKS